MENKNKGNEKGEPRPAFDFEVADWEYLAMIFLLLGSPIGEINIKVMIYKDGKIKSRIKTVFPSGNEISGEKPDHPSLQAAIKETLELSKAFPDSKLEDYEVIYNTSTKGNDLFDLIVKNPNIQSNVTSD